MVQLAVKTTAGRKFSVELELERTVAECKAALVAETEVPVAQQRLIYKGKVLKDEQTLASYGIAAGETIFFVRGSANPRPTPPAGPNCTVDMAANTAATATLPTMTSTPGAAGTATNAPVPPPVPGASPFGWPLFPPAAAAPGGAGNLFAGMPDMAAMQQQLMQNPDMMRQMMESPIVQGIMSNPEIMRSMMQSNPQIQQLLEQNPQLNHIMNDPELLRQSMEAMRNPAAMREMMRSQDTALRNIESHPEGFNALRRMYHDVQEPLLDAAASGTRGSSAPAFTMPGVAGGATSSSAPATSAASTPSTGANPWASAGGASNPPSVAGTMANPWATGAGAFGGGLGGLGSGAPSPELMTQLLQSPLMQPMLDQLASNPQLFVSQLEQMNPQMAAAMNANPQLRQMMSNPEFIRAMLNPQNIQAMMQMQAAMNQLRTSGLFPGLDTAMPPPSGGGASGGPANAVPAAPVDLSALFGALGGAPPMPGATAAAPVGNPEELYAAQLTQLDDMGFSNRAQNLRALQATLGNVHAAVERILSGSI